MAARPVRRPYRTCRRLLYRKFFYVFTCEYCFSHYVALFFMLHPAIACSFPDWRGLVIARLAIVGPAK